VLFRTRYLSELDRLIEQHDWPGAVRAVEAMLDIDAANPRFLNAALYTHVHHGTEESRARVIELCDRIAGAARHAEPPGPAEALLTVRGKLYRHLARGEWVEAIRWIEPFEAKESGQQAWLHALESAIQEEFGAGSPVSQIQKSESLSPEEWELMTLEMAALVELRILRNPERAIRAIEARSKLDDEAGAGFWADAIAAADATEKTELRDRAVERLSSMAPRHSLLGSGSEGTVQDEMEAGLFDSTGNGD
jgi:hypothetical protein